MHSRSQKHTHIRMWGRWRQRPAHHPCSRLNRDVSHLGGTTQCNLHDRQCKHHQHQTPFGKQLPGHITTAHYTSPCYKWVLHPSGTACPSPCYWTGTWGTYCSRTVLPQHLCTVYGMLGVVLIYRHWFVDINSDVFVYSWLAPHPMWHWWIHGM